MKFPNKSPVSKDLSCHLLDSEGLVQVVNVSTQEILVLAKCSSYREVPYQISKEVGDRSCLQRRFNVVVSSNSLAILFPVRFFQMHI